MSCLSTLKLNNLESICCNLLINQLFGLISIVVDVAIGDESTILPILGFILLGILTDTAGFAATSSIFKDASENTSPVSTRSPSFENGSSI